MQRVVHSGLGRVAQRYFIAAWTVGLASAGTFLSSSFMTPGLSPLFLLAVMVSAWRGGLGAGLLATALSTLATVYAFIPPHFSFSVDPDYFLRLFVFTFAAVIIGTLSSARRKAEVEREALLARERTARIEAEQANAVKDEFLAAISHELRTPLTTIKALTRVLLRKNPTESERREYLEDIASECDRQIDLVHNLLDLSHIKAGGVQLKLQPVDAGEVLRACEKIERVEAAERHHELSVEVAPNLPSILADRDALRRAVCTIVENAIKYTPDGGQIRLLARPGVDGQVAIEVEDNGPGIHAEDLPHIFESFYRGRAICDSTDLSGADDRQIPGIGLGLHLARVLIEGMNGSIEARSQIGLGSNFTFRLPVWRAEINAEGDELETSIVKTRAENFAGGTVSPEER
jgi:signal transduction histidine kinase